MSQTEPIRSRRDVGGPRVLPVFRALAVTMWVLFAASRVLDQHPEVFRRGLQEVLGLSGERVLRDFWLWQLGTHVLFHKNIFLLVVNTLLMLTAGAELEQRWGTWKFLLFTGIAGLGGGILSCLVDPEGRAYGATGAVMAVAFAGMLAFPDRQYFGLLRARHLFWLALVTEFVACLFLLSEPGNPDHVRWPHLSLLFGGLAAGWIFIRTEPSVSRATYVWLRRRDIRRKREMVKIRRKVDEILEKIKVFGMDHLSRKERAFLLRASRLFQKEISSESEVAHRD